MHELPCGGSVRDALLGPATSTSPPLPGPTRSSSSSRAGRTPVWDVGIDFGTVGALKDGYRLEITTYRSESYDPTSRKP